MIEPVTFLISIPAIIAMVNWAKKVGLPTKRSPILAMVLGVALSVAQAYVYAETPVTPAVIYGALMVGVMMGLAASGIHDVGTSGDLTSLLEGPPDDRSDVLEYQIGDAVYAGPANERVAAGDKIRPVDTDSPRRDRGLPLNVKEYGAAGDGLTDDTGAFNAAFTDSLRRDRGDDELVL